MTGPMHTFVSVSAWSSSGCTEIVRVVASIFCFGEGNWVAFGFNDFFNFRFLFHKPLWAVARFRAVEFDLGSPLNLPSPVTVKV